jgi:hypothetical protein
MVNTGRVNTCAVTRTVRRMSRALPGAALVMAGSATMAGVAGAADEGPGYGGRTDRLSVTWSSGTAPALAAAGTAVSASGGMSASAAGGTAASSTGELVVRGSGFRGGSPVSVQFGSDAVRRAGADQTGTLLTGMRPTTGATSSGTTVLAQGQDPSGGSLTLVGAVPPRPAGWSPAGAASWVSAVVLLGLGGSSLAGRLTRRVKAVANATDRGDRTAAGR